ncbi:aldo/keto reductase [Roseomonas sp. OT10]|uniref:aldo/keto reductase n=1 Tax=Roseomonas cutis TaxID=2897332 RepID=UPI001E649C8F|nr:aldo/keto reductase [Roseomonas sp. OT10]UFN50591.1 aldo/keto reductase [Roseomonas sp. OT10]
MRAAPPRGWRAADPRPFGRSGLTVSRLGFGAAPLGDLFARLDEDTAIGAARAALAAGLTLLDVAPLYGHGLAEHRLGTALRDVPRDSVVLSSKVGRVLEPGRPAGFSGYVNGLPFAARYDYSGDGARRSLEQSLLRLGTDRLDIVLVHDLDPQTHGPGWEGRMQEALDGVFPALLRLRDEGVVRAVGIGVNDAAAAARAIRAADLDAVLIAGRYSLLEQPAAGDLLPLCAARGVGVMLGGVFNSGILATGASGGGAYNYARAPEAVVAKVRRLEAVCIRHGIPLSRAALHFAAAHPAVASVVVGAVAAAEVAQNVAALEAPVPASLWAELKAEGLLPEEAPTP